MDVDTDAAATLIPRLNMYKLRAEVTISETDLIVSRGLNDAPEGAFADPRDANLGWRYYGAKDHNTDAVDWDALRVDHKIPEMGRELDAESYILEMGFEGLNGVDFRKGCYVGQEVTARMKHKTELRKGLVRLVLTLIFLKTLTSFQMVRSLGVHIRAPGNAHLPMCGMIVRMVTSALTTFLSPGKINVGLSAHNMSPRRALNNPSFRCLPRCLRPVR